MKRRPLGRSGRDVSAIGLGCMGMSEFYGPTDDEQSLDTLAAALDLGIDFLDTADAYGIGRNEELVGRFLKGRRDRVVLATKFAIVRDAKTGSRRIDNSPAYVRQACDASLKRLGIETIDLYYCHRRDPAVPVEDMVGAMAELVAAGKVRYLGLSEVSPATLRRAHAVHPITALQSEYSLWSREPEKETLATCRELGITFVAYSPLGRAFLTGKIESPESLAPDDFRRSNPRFLQGGFRPQQEAGRQPRRLRQEEGRDLGADRARLDPQQAAPCRADPRHAAAELPDGKRRRRRYRADPCRYRGARRPLPAGGRDGRALCEHGEYRGLARSSLHSLFPPRPPKGERAGVRGSQFHRAVAEKTREPHTSAWHLAV